LSTTSVPSTHSRTPSSVVAVKTVSPPVKSNVPSQRAEKSSMSPAPGPPPPQA
jgi:hypothetical protein